MDFKDSDLQTIVPTKIVERIKILFNGITEEISVPLATFESPLWHSVKRGALVSQKTKGISVAVIDDIMTRSAILEAEDLCSALRCKKWIDTHRSTIATAVQSTSHIALFKDISVEIVGNLIYIRLVITTGNASGHNMVTKAMDEVLSTIIAECGNVKYVTVSGNYCTDKKVSSINGILGRGKRVSAEIFIPNDLCLSILKVQASDVVDLNIKKNFLGSILSGGVRSANAHFANIVLGIYLATGQDPANIVEASQGITYAQEYGNGLYFSVNIPNIIVGTIGNGKNLDFAKSNLELLKCNSDDEMSSKRLAAIIAATVLCSELSLIAAQVNQKELMRAHIAIERNGKQCM